MSRCCIYCRIGGTANEPNQIAMNSQLEMLRKAAEDLGLTAVAEVTFFLKVALTRSDRASKR